MATSAEQQTENGMGRIRLMLSGGGHRAMLGGTGAILFLIHQGHWQRVDEIVSVSGGSVVNAAAMNASDETDEELLVSLRSLFDSIRSDGAKPWRTPRRLLSSVAVLLAPAAMVVLVAGALGLIDALDFLAKPLIGMILGLLAPMIMVQFGRRAFSGYMHDYVNSVSDASDVDRSLSDESLRSRSRQHVICATGRASAATYYLWAGGQRFSSGGDLSIPRDHQVVEDDMLGVSAQGMSIGDAAYASCSVPLLGRLRSPDDVINERAIAGEVLIDPGWTGKFGQQVSDRLKEQEQPSFDPDAPQIIVIDAGTRTPPQGKLSRRLAGLSLVSLMWRWTNLSNDAVYVNDLIDALGAAALVRLNDMDSGELSTRAVAPAPGIFDRPSTIPTAYPEAEHLWGRFNELRSATGTITLFNVDNQLGFDALLAGYVGSYLALTPAVDGVTLYHLLLEAGDLFGLGTTLAEHWDPTFH